MNLLFGKPLGVRPYRLWSRPLLLDSLDFDLRLLVFCDMPAFQQSRHVFVAQTLFVVDCLLHSIQGVQGLGRKSPVYFLVELSFLRDIVVPNVMALPLGKFAQFRLDLWRRVMGGFWNNFRRGDYDPRGRLCFMLTPG